MLEISPLVMALWSALLSVVISLMGWIMNNFYRELVQLRAENRYIRENHALKSDLKDTFNLVLDALRRLEDKLDRKADKGGIR